MHPAPSPPGCPCRVRPCSKELLQLLQWNPPRPEPMGASWEVLCPGWAQPSLCGPWCCCCIPGFRGGHCCTSRCTEHRLPWPSCRCPRPSLRGSGFVQLLDSHAAHGRAGPYQKATWSHPAHWQSQLGQPPDHRFGLLSSHPSVWSGTRSQSLLGRCSKWPHANGTCSFLCRTPTPPWSGWLHHWRMVPEVRWCSWYFFLPRHYLLCWWWAHFETPHYTGSALHLGGPCRPPARAGKDWIAPSPNPRRPQPCWATTCWLVRAVVPWFSHCIWPGFHSPSAAGDPRCGFTTRRCRRHSICWHQESTSANSRAVPSTRGCLFPSCCRNHCGLGTAVCCFSQAGCPGCCCPRRHRPGAARRTAAPGAQCHSEKLPGSGGPPPSGWTSHVDLKITCRGWLRGSERLSSQFFANFSPCHPSQHGVRDSLLRHGSSPSLSRIPLPSWPALLARADWLALSFCTDFPLLASLLPSSTALWFSVGSGGQGSNWQILDRMPGWIGLRENLQETIDFPMKYGVFL